MNPIDVKRRIVQKLKRIVKDSFWLFKVTLIAILLAILLRVFLFASFSVPTPSMEPTIMAGDFVMVNKLIPGPRLFKSWGFLNGTDFSMRRLKGWRNIKRNDILVFNFPYSKGKLEIDLNVFYAKRCIAIPGDTFYIDNGIYKIRGLTEPIGYLPLQQVVAERLAEEFVEPVFNCFPHNSALGWNIKNFGPIYVPEKNDVVSINTISILLYKNLIEYETNQKVTIEEGKVFLDDKLINDYLFLKNYYFMAGDHAPDSQDSRYWGLLPEDHIVGKAFFVWKSKDVRTGKWQWKRFFKRI